jgi:hypothetical protein
MDQRNLKERLSDINYIKNWFDQVGWEAIREIERLEKMVEWKTIDTAPTDTVVMCFDPTWYDTPLAMKRNDKGEWVAWFNEGLGKFNPTHWKPIDLPQTT